jgi:hypothetical protein
MNPISPVEHSAGYGLLPGAIVSQGSITDVNYSLSSDKRTIYFNLSGQCYVRYYEWLQQLIGEQQVWQNCFLTGLMTPNLS